MKFDLVFSNPPYNGSFDIKILKEVQPICNEMVIVHPSTWCIDLKGKSKLFNEFRTQIDGKVKSVEMFNGNPIFDIGLFVPTMITHLKNDHNGMCNVKFFEEEFKVKSIFDVTKFGEEWFTIVKPFMDKFVGCDTIMQYRFKLRKEENDKFYCQLAYNRGHVYINNMNHMVMDDFYTMVMKDSNKNNGIRKNTITRDDQWHVWEFDSQVNQSNFIDYLKTDFARFCLSIYKNNSCVFLGELELIPWLDFTESWNDEKLFNHFQIDKETQDYIRSFLPDYYGIRN